MSFSIHQWNEITEFLNGYVLDRVVFQGDNIIGVNSQGEGILLAIPSGVYWSAVDGKAYEAIEGLLWEAKALVKERSAYDPEAKKEILKEVFEENIKLYNRPYNS